MRDISALFTTPFPLAHLQTSASSVSNIGGPTSFDFHAVSPVWRLKATTYDCWVFHHMVKSGGSTVRSLTHRLSARNNIRRAEYANSKWLAGTEGRLVAEDIFRTGKGLIYGGYAEGLRSIEPEGRCKWFTVFRHPISRLVSAFFYCKYMRRWEHFAIWKPLKHGNLAEVFLKQ